MKPIRQYSDGQWLLLLWAFIVVFLVTGAFISKPVLVVAILAAAGAAYTTFLYVRENTGGSSARNRSASDPAPGQAPDADPHEGGTP